MKIPFTLIYPFFFGLFPILYAYQQYYAMASVGDLIFLVGLIFGVIIALQLLFRYVGIEQERSSLFLSVLLILVFLPGYINDTLPVEIASRVAWYILLGFVVVAACVGGIAIFGFKNTPGNVTKIAIFLGIVLVGTALIGISAQVAGEANSPSDRSQDLEQLMQNQSAGMADHDIYYIVLDGYTNSEILRKYYHFDNGEFEMFLKSRGFYIANESPSNYDRTRLSIPSSINMEYLAVTSPTKGLIDAFKENYLARFLKSRGYKVIFLRSDYFVTNQMEGTDVVLNSGIPDTYEKEFFRKTIFLSTPYFTMKTNNPTWHRHVVNESFSALEAAAEIPGRKFVFAHIMVPHEPFIFGPDGAESLCPRDKICGYEGQIQYVNTRVERLVDSILSSSQDPPIIVIQGDHGPRLFFRDAESMEESLMILNAYRLPDGGNRFLYPNITPVNSFRVVLNAYFDTEMPKLEDISYFETIPYTYSAGEFNCSCSSSEPQPLYFCMGWAARGVGKNAGFRWMANNATLLIPSDHNQTMRLNFRDVTTFNTSHLIIFNNEIPIETIEMNTEPANVTLTLDLLPGTNEVRFFVPDGCQGTVADKKKYCFNAGFSDFTIEPVEKVAG